MSETGLPCRSHLQPVYDPDAAEIRLTKKLNWSETNWGCMTLIQNGY